MLVGNFITPTVMDRYGRKVAHVAVSLPAIFSWLLLAIADNPEMLIFARFLQGLSAGLMLPLRSVLVSEYSSPKYRGGFLTTISLAQGVGIFLIHVVGSLLSWQRTSVICGVASFLCLVMAFFLPESPSWLAVKGKYEESRKAYRWLRGDNEESELEELIRSRIMLRVDIERQKGSRVKRLTTIRNDLKKREFYLPIIITAHCYMMINVCGNITMPAFSVVIIRIMVSPTANAHALMIVLDSLRIIANVIAVFIIYKFKRRTILFSTGALCVIVHIAIATYVYAKENEILYYDEIWIPCSLLAFQFLCIGIGMVPMPSVIAGEVIPLQFRSIISSIGVVVLTVFMFIILKSFPLLVDSIYLSGTYWIYAGILIYVLSVLWFVLPETSGKTLQEIEEEMKQKHLPVEDEAEVNLQSERIDKSENGESTLRS
ncbi:facilitated trehalose transporter Tret1-like [Battus philenor]|uniref:facilitated trehalose transporter Tret1-like n=1 Tax=Battus philenor TaxID=42288 RepID=UPI0035D018B6